MRTDGRKVNQLRPVKITPHFQKNASGSCLIEMGGTKVICSAMFEDTIPPFLKNSGKGWLTAEYSMLPASSSQRINRERNKVGGRTHEIQRLIGRSLRSVIDFNFFGEKTLSLDCDVLDADGGTRTASITGSYVAALLALKKHQDKLPNFSKLVKGTVAAISVGVVKGSALLDLNYEEDKNAEVDMNIVMTSDNQFVEVQGTAEGKPFSLDTMNQMLTLAKSGIEELFEIQKSILK
jgi:ribonuclease PH